MNIFHKVAMQGLVKNRARTLVTVIGVALSAAMITAVATFGISLLSYMIGGSIKSYGDWHIGFYGADSAFVQQQEDDTDVRHVAAVQEIGYAALSGGENPDKPYLFLAGMDDDALETMSIELLSGRLPQDDGEVLVPAHLATNGGVRFTIGDTLTLSTGYRVDAGAALGQHSAYRAGEETLIPLRQKTYTVVGICQRPRFEERTAPGYTLITRPDPALSGSTYSAYVALENPFRLGAYAAKTAENHATIRNDNVLRYMGLSSDRMFTTLFVSLAVILIGLIMLGSVFLIYNSFSISLSDRMHQFGMLMSVGATQKQLRKSVLFEGVCIGALGIPLGILIGIPSISGVLMLVRENFGNVLYDGVPLVPVISVPVLIGAAAVSLITILISAYIPAKKAAGTPVMACIRQTGEIKVDPRDMKTSPAALRRYGLEGTLALKNFKRNKRRYRSIVLSLTLSVVLFVATSSFSAYLNQLGDQAKAVTSFDIMLTTRDLEDERLLDLHQKLLDVSGVTKSGYEAFFQCPLEIPSALLSDAYWAYRGERAQSATETIAVSYQFLDEATLWQILEDLKLPVEEYFEEGAPILTCAKMQVSDKPVHSVYDLDDLLNAADPELSFPTPDGTMTRRLHCATFTPPDTPLLSQYDAVEDAYVFYLLIPYSQKPLFELAICSPDVYSKGISFLSDTPTQSTAQIDTLLLSEDIGDYTLNNVKKILEENNNILFIVNLFSGVFIAMISLIAVVNVFNTISTNVKLRRRELAMLRSVGMADRAFEHMMRFECALYGVRTLLWGVPLSVLLSFGIYYGLDMGAGELQYIFPLSSLAISMLGVFLVILLTMTYATSAIRRDNIIDALRDEMS